VAVAKHRHRHVVALLMVRHHHSHEVGIDVAGRLHRHVVHHLCHGCAVLGQNGLLETSVPVVAQMSGANCDS
jgi:hypothetical protein